MLMRATHYYFGAFAGQNSALSNTKLQRLAELYAKKDTIAITNKGNHAKCALQESAKHLARGTLSSRVSAVHTPGRYASAFEGGKRYHAQAPGRQ